jgi:hypothetical protein
MQSNTIRGLFGYVICCNVPWNDCIAKESPDELPSSGRSFVVDHMGLWVSVAVVFVWMIPLHARLFGLIIMLMNPKIMTPESRILLLDLDQEQRWGRSTLLHGARSIFVST